MAEFDNLVQGWNLNKGYYDHINDLIILVDQAAYYNKPDAWRKFLRMIYRKIHKRMTEKAKQEVDQLFKDVDNELNTSDLNNSMESMSILANRKARALDILDELETMILDIMHEEDMLPSKPKRVPPERAVEDFGYGVNDD